MPFHFPPLACRKVAPRVVEELATKRHCVPRNEFIRGCILSSPRITRGRDRNPLIAAGSDVARYHAEWNAY